MKHLTSLLFVVLLFVHCEEEQSDPVNTGGGTGMLDETITRVNIDPLSLIEGDEDRSAFLSIRLNQASDELVRIQIETADGSATAPNDYLAVSESIEFQPGSTQENLRVEIIGDEVTEQDESFTVSITNVQGAVLGPNASINFVIENDDFGGAVDIPPTGYTTPLAYDGMDLIWQDEFEGTALNENNWNYKIGNGNDGWGNNELQFYREENTSIQDGHLVIEARNQNFSGFNYTSSRLTTEGKFTFTHGRVDIRAALPEGQGIWPALWMLGENITTVGWPRCGEIDIMELVGHQPSTVHSTVHYANSAGSHIQSVTGTSNLSGGEKFSDEFHVFSLIWSQDRMEFYLDDNLQQVITRSSLGASNPYPFNEPFYFLFNIAVGGNWPGSPDATTQFPQHMFVDYIRVFQDK